MTQIITRYFESAAEGRLAKEELIQRERLSYRIMDFYTKADGLADKLIASHVNPDAARAYQERMASGGAVLLVRAGYKPLGVARTTREVTARMGAADMGALVQETFVRDVPNLTLNVMTGHPHFLTRPRDPDSTTFHMADWPIALISRRKPFRGSVIEPHGHMANWPIPLISRRKPYTASIFHRHKRMASFPIGLISKREPFIGSIFPRHARMAAFPIPLISRRKPYTGTLIGRHPRMANWPFPHLINGKMGTNALVPGAPRMANFPIPLLSRRKPFTGSVIPRHGRMASFPVKLLSQRKPYTGSLIPKHGRMADAILPLTVEHSGTESGPAASGFSLSKVMGIPTIIRR